MKQFLSRYILPLIFAISVYWNASESAMIADINDIRQAGEHDLKELYLSYREEFGQWVRKYYAVDDDSAGEIYQQAFIAFYYNIRDGKVKELSSSMKTYLFAIGKNIARDKLRQETRFVPVQDDFEVDDWELSAYDKTEISETQHQLRDLVRQMGDPCKTVLELFYFQNYSMKGIAEHMNYKTEQIAAKRKFICLKQIRQKLSKTSYFNEERI